MDEFTYKGLRGFIVNDEQLSVEGRVGSLWEFIEDKLKRARKDELENIWIKCNCVTSLVLDIIENRLEELEK